MGSSVSTVSSETGQPIEFKLTFDDSDGICERVDLFSAPYRKLRRGQLCDYLTLNCVLFLRIFARINYILSVFFAIHLPFVVVNPFLLCTAECELGTY